MSLGRIGARGGVGIGIEPRVPRPSLIAASAVPVHLLLALTTDLSPDEAYYLAAARLGARIPDHPPLTVAMLGLSDRLTFLPVELRVRLWAVAASFATSLLLAELAKRRGASLNGQAFATWVGTWALLPMAGGFVTTPDTALLVAVALALLSEDLAGPALAIGAFAKVVALPVAALLASQQKRARLVTVVAVVVAVALLIPQLRFQLVHAFASRGDTPWSALGALGAVGAAVGAQLLLWSPVAFGLGVIGLRENAACPPAGLVRQDTKKVAAKDRALVLGMTALLLASAIVRAVPPEPNWWAPAALALVPAMGLGVERLSMRARRWVLASVIAPTVLAVVHVVHPFLPLAPSADPTARLHGWRSGRSTPGALDAAQMPGVGAYGAAAEACIYDGACEEIRKRFDKSNDPGLLFSIR